jgi:hypothetical protein
VAAYCNAALDPLCGELRSRRHSRRSVPSPRRRPSASMADAAVACDPKVGKGLFSVLNTVVSVARVSKTFFKGGPECHVCCSKLGKRFFRRKHACQLCQKSVCSVCSPSKLLFQKGGCLQRVCTPCSSSMPNLFAKQRLVQCDNLVARTPS